MDGILLLYLVGLGLTMFAAYFLFGSFLWGAGYQPTPTKVARRMMELGEVGSYDHVLDLGAGTGKLVFMAAERAKAEVTGIEAEPLRYLFLVLRRAFSPARHRVRLLRGNIFEENLTQATVVLVFLWPSAMERLKPRMENELRPGVRVVSYWHPIPGWEADRVDRRLRVYLYVKKPARPKAP